MHETPLATSSPVSSKIRQMGRLRAKYSRRSVSLLDVSAIDVNPDVSCQISESNETLASGYRDSGYVRSETSSLEEDDSKASKDLVEELKFRDVLICELQESNRGLRMRCADAENKIWRLRVKCQSHCGCCQVEEVAPSLSDSAGEEKDETPNTSNAKYDFLTHDLFQFKRTQPFSVSYNDLNLSLGPDRLANAPDRLANSFSVQETTSRFASPKKPLSRSKSSGTIGTQTHLHHSSRQNDDQAAEKIFALKVQQWQREHSLKLPPNNEMSVEQRLLSSTKIADPVSKLSHPWPKSMHARRTSDGLDIGEGEASLLSVITERDSSLEVDTTKALSSALHPPDGFVADSSHSAPFADITNQRSSAYSGSNQVPKASNSLQHASSSSNIFDPGLLTGGLRHTPSILANKRLEDIDWANSETPRSEFRSPQAGERYADNKRATAREQPCGNCRCSQPSPVIIVPTGCCSCCKTAYNQIPPPKTHRCNSDASFEMLENRNRSHLKLDVSTDSSDLLPIFEIKSKTSASGKFNIPSSPEFDSKTERVTQCRNASDRDCKCSPHCSGLTVPLVSKFDAKAEYKRKIEESMKKFALDARAETESLSFQPWTSPDSPEMSPLMKRLAESSHYVNQMAVAINRIANRFQHVTGAPNPVNPSP